MSETITQTKEHLSAMLHGGSLKRVRNIEALFERSANIMLTKIDPINTIRNVPLSNTVHDDVYNYSLPSDYKSLIDLIPQDDRQSLDSAGRRALERFDLRKALANKTLTIEGSEGSKIIRINWRSRQGKVLNTMDSLTANGTWDASGTSTNVVLDTITKKTGAGSIRFDQAASGDGINNDDMSQIDMTNEDEIADAFLSFYIKDATELAKLTSCTLIWGNDQGTTNYWTGVAQTTQADGTAFRVGWNEIKVPWSTATETGTVDATKIDSAVITFVSTSAITDIRVDQIVFSIGRNFDIKYYSKFLLKNTSGTFITRTTSDDDTVVLDSDALEIWHLENLIQAAHQIEGADSNFDMDYARRMLNGDPGSTDRSGRMGLYGKYRAEYPTQSKKAIGFYGSKPDRGRFGNSGRFSR